NRLFLVGDPKQAIFEFRGANPRVFHAAIETLHETARLDLTENFRSRPEIVSFINGFGAELLPDQFVRIKSEAQYGDAPLDVPAVSVIYASNTDGLPDARVREAGAVCEEVGRLLRERPLVRDPAAREVKWVKLAPKHI